MTIHFFFLVQNGNKISPRQISIPKSINDDIPYCSEKRLHWPGGGAPFLVRGAHSLAKGAVPGQGTTFLSRGAPSLARGRRHWLGGDGRRHWPMAMERHF